MDRQEWLDQFYFRHGPCCAGCDWWRHMSSHAGDCMKAAPVDGDSRWEMLGITNISLRKLPPGHVVTRHDHLCGDFKDEFDWTTLPLPYRKRVGDPTIRAK